MYLLIETCFLVDTQNIGRSGRGGGSRRNWSIDWQWLQFWISFWRLTLFIVKYSLVLMIWYLQSLLLQGAFRDKVFVIIVLGGCPQRLSWMLAVLVAKKWGQGRASTDLQEQGGCGMTHESAMFRNICFLSVSPMYCRSWKTPGRSPSETLAAKRGSCWSGQKTKVCSGSVANTRTKSKHPENFSENSTLRCLWKWRIPSKGSYLERKVWKSRGHVKAQRTGAEKT